MGLEKHFEEQIVMQEVYGKAMGVHLQELLEK